jgi:hypothetical protein
LVVRSEESNPDKGGIHNGSKKESRKEIKEEVSLERSQVSVHQGK